MGSGKMKLPCKSQSTKFMLKKLAEGIQLFVTLKQIVPMALYNEFYFKKRRLPKEEDPGDVSQIGNIFANACRTLMCKIHGIPTLLSIALLSSEFDSAMPSDIPIS